MIQYNPIIKRSRQVPFGYDFNPDTPDVYVPNEKILPVLEKAREYYFSDATSKRNLIDWIAAQTGRKLSLEGLRKVMERKY